MISPIEVKKQEFSRAMRGYDTAEVRAFLDSVAVELERLSETARVNDIEISRLKAELSSYQKMERNMKEALVNAQETLREAREGSQREADLKLREAEIEADKIIKEAHRRREEVMREIEALVARRDAFVRKLRALMRSELELIDLLNEQDPSSQDKGGNGGD